MNEKNIHTPAKYGWSVVEQKDGAIGVYNKKEVLVFIIKFKNGRYRFYDTGNQLLLSGNCDIELSLEKILTKYYYAQPIA